MVHQDAPGTTFKRHMRIARGLMSEDDYLLTEILFNPRTPRQIERIQRELAALQDMIRRRDTDAMKTYLAKLRKKIDPEKE
jgi:prephenate dehydrogenase